MKNKQEIISSFAELFAEGNNQLPIRAVTTHEAVSYEIEIFDDFIDSQQFSEAVSIMRNAGEDDCVTILFDSHGGDTGAMTTLLAAIDLCKATVLGYAMSKVHSAAAVCFCACDGWYVNPDAEIMWHTGSMRLGNTVDNVSSMVQHHKKITKLRTERHCSKFLTRKELTSIHNGKDFWLTGEELIERIDKHLEKQNTQSAASDEKMLLELLKTKLPTKKAKEVLEVLVGDF